MRRRAGLLVAASGSVVWWYSIAGAEEQSSNTTAPTVERGSRVRVSANGATFDPSGEGRGGAVGWLQQLRSGPLIGLDFEHQSVDDTQWTFASVTGTFTHVGSAGHPLTSYGEIHGGSGHAADRRFDYSIVAAGINQVLNKRISLLFEDRWISVDTSHGNLPRIGFTYLSSPRLATSVSYARSIGGNLATRLVVMRLDHYGRGLNVLVGGALGDGAPAAVNAQPGSALPNGKLRQLFFGVSKGLRHGETQVIVDGLDSGGTKRLTLTLAYTIYVHGHDRSANNESDAL